MCRWMKGEKNSNLDITSYGIGLQQHIVVNILGEFSWKFILKFTFEDYIT